MTPQVQASSSQTFVARMAIGARLRAQVMDAEMQVQIKKYTEVIAERGPGPRDVTILWPYGEATAQAVIDRSFLQSR